MTNLRSALDKYLSMRKGLGYKYEHQTCRLLSQAFACHWGTQRRLVPKGPFRVWGDWIKALLERRRPMVVAIAVANKLARKHTT
ncbi:hypothetical protein CI41S_66610 [Bradyrhizobium ivorense]|nr:hypothetical protein [Bradyrhizobium ivorense]VIO79096.1 hypothetical protein CI41S_66610 [Bradyrhizobium ivorense]